MPARIAMFCPPLRGHWQRMRPVLAGLVRHGCEVHVYAGTAVADQVVAAGARFVDVYARHPPDAADAVTFPLGCRQLSYAAAYAEPLAAELRARGTDLIVHDSFAVVGAVVGQLLGRPVVNVRAGHNRNAAVVDDVRRHAPRTHIGPACLAAVDTLGAWGLGNVTPYFYLSHLSADLNLLCEPPQFLTPAETDGFAPAAFFGSLHLDGTAGEGTAGAGPGSPPVPWPDLAGRSGAPGRRRVFVCLGTHGSSVYAPEILSVLETLADAFSARGVPALFSLGDVRGELDAARRLQRPGLTVVPWVDQPAVLAEADLFVTHHGLNSTHEAVYAGVPMLSCPLFGDQPSQARRCQELGLAVPLGSGAPADIRAEDVGVALGRVADEEVSLRARLGEARQWELDTHAGRDAVIERMLDLAGAG